MKMEKVVLFDGTNLDGWTARSNGETPDWKVEDGIMTVGHSDIISKYEFGDAHIHVEFRCPDMPDCTGQAKGNSGVYVHGCYEVQVLDSYGIETPLNNDCSGIYSIYAPLANACKPALEWQTYDIIFRAPRFNQYGEVKEDSRMTLLHNGIVVHNNIVLPSVTPGGVTGDRRPARGPLMLQDHGNAVSFRNVWVMPLDEEN